MWHCILCYFENDPAETTPARWEARHPLPAARRGAGRECTLCARHFHACVVSARTRVGGHDVYFENGPLSAGVSVLLRTAGVSPALLFVLGARYEDGLGPRRSRGPSRSRCVFLRRIAPHVGLSQPSVVSKIARGALQRAGLLPTGRVGAHIFRHSLATRMIRRGASLEEISQVLRHRSTGTTQLYAKVDFERLREVAMPWPSAEAPR